jgi:hypothetical protein
MTHKLYIYVKVQKFMTDLIFRNKAFEKTIDNVKSHKDVMFMGIRFFA